MYQRIPLTRGATLEEAEAAIKSPPAAHALFPFRMTSEEVDSEGGPRHQSGTSRETGRRPIGPSWHENPSSHGKEAPLGADGIRSKPSRTVTLDDCGRPGTSTSAHHEENLSKKKGTARPHHSKEAQKYGISFAGKPVELLLTKYMERNKSFSNDAEYCCTCLALVAASLARNTWKRYNSALRLWEKFRTESGLVVEFLNVETWEKKFLIWGWRDRGLNISTLKIYLSELKELGRLAKIWKSWETI